MTFSDYSSSKKDLSEIENILSSSKAMSVFRNWLPSFFQYHENFLGQQQLKISLQPGFWFIV